MPPKSETSKIAYAALTLGYKAQFAQLDQAELARLRDWAEAALPAPDALRARIVRAHEAYPPVRHNAAALAAWGRALRDDALRLSYPTPVDSHRSDIHG